MRVAAVLAHALVGAVVTVLVGLVIPFAPIFGGVGAGYLHGEDGLNGYLVGAVSGLLALAPSVAFGLGITSPWQPFRNVFLAYAVVVVLGVSLVYHVALGALGGWIGCAVRHER